MSTRLTVETRGGFHIEYLYFANERWIRSRIQQAPGGAGELIRKVSRFNLSPGSFTHPQPILTQPHPPDTFFEVANYRTHKWRLSIGLYFVDLASASAMLRSRYENVDGGTTQIMATIQRGAETIHPIQVEANMYPGTVEQLFHPPQLRTLGQMQTWVRQINGRRNYVQETLDSRVTSTIYHELIHSFIAIGRGVRDAGNPVITSSLFRAFQLFEDRINREVTSLNSDLQNIVTGMARFIAARNNIRVPSSGPVVTGALLSNPASWFVEEAFANRSATSLGFSSFVPARFAELYVSGLIGKIASRLMPQGRTQPLDIPDVTEHGFDTLYHRAIALTSEITQRL
jgi:hypothetical protein